MSDREELVNPDVIVAGWRVDRDGNSYRIFRRMTVRAEDWHEKNRGVGRQYGRSIAVAKSNQASVLDAMKKDGLVVRERTHERKRSTYVGEEGSCRPPI